jgi:hypothetical protein
MIPGSLIMTRTKKKFVAKIKRHWMQEAADLKAGLLCNEGVRKPKAEVLK